MGVAMVISAWGEGVKFCHAPPPPRRIARRPPKARVKLCLGLNTQGRYFYAVGTRVMEVSMVIAAWGVGVGLLVSPSPSSDRSSPAKTRVKSLAGSSDTPPFAARALAPPPRQISKKRDKNIEANL
jgi:hypothetical protein